MVNLSEVVDNCVSGCSMRGNVGHVEWQHKHVRFIQLTATYNTTTAQFTLTSLSLSLSLSRTVKHD